MRIKLIRRRVALVLSAALLMSLGLPAVSIAAAPALPQSAYVLPGARAGALYEFQFRSEGGLAPLTWRIAQGTLPPGLQFNPQGKLSGTPQQAQREPYHFIVEVADSAQTPERITQACSLTVQAAPLRIVLNQPLRILPPAEQAADTPTPAPETAAAPSLNGDGRSSGAEASAALPTATADRSAQASRAASPPVATAPQAAATPTNGNAANAPTNNASRNGAAAATTRVISGRLRPSSMDRVFSLIQQDASLKRDPEVLAYLCDAGFDEIPGCQSNSNNNGTNGSTTNGTTAGTTSNTVADTGSDCDSPSANGTNLTQGGRRKTAVVSLLEYILSKAHPGDSRHPKPPSSSRLASVSAQLTSLYSSQPAASGTSSPGVSGNQVMPTPTPTPRPNFALVDGLSERTLTKLIDLLNNYIGSARIHVENQAGKLVATTTANKDGCFSVELKDNEPEQHYVVSSSADNFHSREKVFINGARQKVNLMIEDRPVSLLTRAVVGYQQAGAASAEFEQNYFFDLFVSQTLPMKFKIDPDFGERWRSWMAARSASLPQKGDVTLRNLSLNFAEKAGDLPVRDVARVFDFLGGVEVRILQNRALLPSFARDTKQKFSLSLIGSFGFVTPTDPTNLPTIFNLTDPIKQKLIASNSLSAEEVARLNDAKTKFVTFANADRDRFFRQYYAGFRVQTFFFNRHDVPMQRFPAQFDLTYGQNEYVTGGRVQGGVFRFDGYFPLPYEGLKFINLYGTAVIKPARAQISRGILLESVSGDNAPTVSDERVFQFSRPQFNRDYYKVGVGIDFVSFVEVLRKLKTGN